MAEGADRLLDMLVNDLISGSADQYFVTKRTMCIFIRVTGYITEINIVQAGVPRDVNRILKS